MSCGQYLGPMQQRLVALSNSQELYTWYTPWMPAIGMDAIKAVLRNRAVSGNFDSRLALQTATIRTDKPSEPTLLEASYLTGAGERCSDILTISSNTGPAFFARLGVACRITPNNTAISQADVGLEVAYEACGKVVGGGTVELTTPGTTSRFEPITGWIPAIHAFKVKAVLIVTNAQGNFRIQLSYRTATTSKEVPNAWNANFEGAWHTGDGEYSTGELSLSGTGDDMWIQFGIEHQLSSGSDGGGEVTTAVAVRS